VHHHRTAILSATSARRACRLLIAESDPSVRRLLAHRLIGGEFDVTELAEPYLVHEKIAVEQPNLVLLELHADDGERRMNALRQVSDAGVIGLLWADFDVDEVSAFAWGVDDCITRPFSLHELVARVRAVWRRVRPLHDRPLFSYGALDIDVAARAVRVHGRQVDLPAREFDLLAHLAAHPNEVLTRAQLLADVWRSCADWQQPATVTEHIHRLRIRLEDDPGHPRHLLTVRGVGYRFSP
jgi:two-component system phosphate regulon response regulator PhoB